ncbi:hypothetical protein JXJ21_06820 [candidate division KSB1 bacterium]|nr:hypothetical protein [candidate division KSB1 bacterium]
MKRQTIFSSLMMLAVLAILCGTTAFPQVLDTYSLDRPYDVVQMNGSKFPEFTGTPVEELYVYAYHSSTSSWEAIPFQIDEKGTDSYYSPDDGLLDDDDELVFMARDLGDLVTPGNWIDDEASKSNYRYTIRVYDNTNNAKQGWAYLYKSSTLTQASRKSYMNYDYQNDRVISDFFEAGYNTNGVLTDFVITAENGGNGTDILDRQKIRLAGLLGPGMEYEMNEDSIRKAEINYIAGPVRVIRRIRNNIIVAGDTLFHDLKMTSRFHPFSMDYSGHANFIEQQGVGLVRQSWDFNANASGMKFHSTSNRNIVVDGASDGTLDDSLTHYALNWMMVTGNPGTIYAVNDLSFVGSSQRLYYWDSSSGKTGDDTHDTGDNKSYGDMGIIIKGYRIRDTLDFKSTIFFLPANQNADIGEPMQTDFANPLLTLTSYGSFRVGVADAKDHSQPREFYFFPNHPNPFNSSTSLKFDLPEKAYVRLRIMNILGQTIQTLVDKSLTAGQHHLIWNGTDSHGNDVVSGVYFSVLEADNYHAIRKLILIK